MKLEFFKVKDYLKSWSVWAASAVTITPVLDVTTPIFNFIPEQYKPIAITVLGLVTLVTRAIKQVKTFGK